MDKSISIWCFTCFTLVAATLASSRFTSLLVETDGPLDLNMRFSIRISARFIGRTMDWVCCLSLWLSLPVSIWLSTGWIGLFLHWEALSRATCLLERLTRKRKWSFREFKPLKG
jgi:hypothetical protein